MESPNHSHRRLLEDFPCRSERLIQERNLSIFTGIFIMVLLICILLRSVFKCFGRSQISVRSNHLEESKSSRVDLLRAIPVLTYGKGEGNSSLSPSFESENCAICLAEFVFGDSVRVLPCMHIFHKDCIDQWLIIRSLVCPICRNRTIESLNATPTGWRNGGTDNNISALMPLHFPILPPL